MITVTAWNSLSPGERSRLLARPSTTSGTGLRLSVQRILEQVRADGDHALLLLTRRFDGCELDRLWVEREELAQAAAALEPSLRRALADSIARIEAFHAAQRPAEIALDTAPGLRCERLVRPIRRVGLYVPAGSAPLPSTLIMLGVPARLAGCRETIVCTPPRADGSIDPTIAATAHLLGIERVARLGGAQAIAAMAYGTESIPRCDKLFGPGSVWVTEAKRQVAAEPDGPDIDLPAGPSEVLVIADAGARPAWIAADLLAQAEHGPDAQAIAVSPSAALLSAVSAAIDAQWRGLPRTEILAESLKHLRLIEVADLEQAFALSNEHAPEHLILHLEDPRAWLSRVEAAGSVFLGPYTPETLGDYTSGTNHVLPTGGAARARSGVSLDSFLLRITVQEASRDGLRAVGPAAMRLAEAEGLAAHRAAIALRLEGG